MPDIAAGHKLTTLDFLPTVSDTEAGAFTFNLTTFGLDADTGTYVDCGVSFVAPYSGRVIIHTAARVGNDTAGAGTEVAPVVRSGGVVGSGSTIVAASSDNAVRSAGTTSTTQMRAGSPLLVPGLTAGDTYNVRLEHRVSGGIGTVGLRHVVVTPTN
jgi:hypothetical protein